MFIQKTKSKNATWTLSTADTELTLAVANNVPVRLMATGAAPDVTPKAIKPVKNRRKNV